MNEPVFILWGVLLLITILLVRFLFKRYGRSLGRYAGFLKIGLTLLTLGLSLLIFWRLPDSAHLIWVARLTIIALACTDVWLAYKLKFSKRNGYDYEQDSFLPEFLFFTAHALAVGMVFVAGPQVLGLVDAQGVDLSRNFWDLPLLFLVPFLALKLADFAGQLPYREVENRWVYPLEYLELTPEQLTDFTRVEFQVRNGVRREYKIGARPDYPWIQAPRALPLGDVFRVTMQERKRRSDLVPINDVGDEHGGDPLFWWLFKRKLRWHPGTWFAKPRYLNPAHSVEVNNLHSYDIVQIRRIPTGDDFTSGMRMAIPFSGDETIIIQR